MTNSGRSSLRTFLLRRSILFVVIGITLTSSISVLLMLRFFAQEIEDRNQLTVSLVTIHLDEHFKFHQRDLQKLSENDELAAYVVAFVARTGAFTRVIKTDSNGKIEMCEPQCSHRIGFDESRQPFFPKKRIESKGTWWSPVFFDEFRGTSTVAVSVPSQQGGFWIGFIDLGHLAEILGPIPLGSGSTLSLIDQVGTFIYHSDSTALKQREGLNLQIDLQSQKQFDHLVVEKIPWLGWSIILEQDPRVQYKPVVVSVLSVIAVAGILLLVLLGWVTQGLRKVFIPLHQLLVTTRQMALGQYQIPHEKPRDFDFTSYDELAILNDGFHSMAKDIHEKSERMVHLNQNLEAELVQNRSSAQAFTTLMKTLSGYTGEAFLQIVASSLRDWLECDIVLVGLLKSPDKKLHIHGFAGLPGMSRITDLDVSHSPCEITLQSGEYECLQGCLDKFPKCKVMQMHAINSYVGTAITDDRGSPIGIIALLSVASIHKPVRLHEVLAILSGRASAELIRMNQESSLVELNRNLSDLTHTLSQRNRDMESMLFATSHDLKAPLVNIAGFSKELGELLAELEAEHISPDSPEKKRNLHRLIHEEIPECRQYILNGVQRMEHLLNGLLKIFRLSRNPLHREHVDLTKIMDRLQEVLAFDIQKSRAEIRVESIPFVWGDPDELMQVLQNLLSNALKYSHPDRNPVIHFSGWQQSAEVVLVFEDNGRGISLADQDRVFQVFFRAGNNQGITGDGIGLSVCSRILERHGGAIALESELGKGTRFIMRIPVAP